MVAPVCGSDFRDRGGIFRVTNGANCQKKAFLGRLICIKLVLHDPPPSVISVAIYYGYISWRHARGRCPGRCARLRRCDLRRSDTMPRSTARERHETPRFGTPRDKCPSIAFHGRPVAPHCVCACRAVPEDRRPPSWVERAPSMWR